jgi:hypothetical protein
MSNGSDRCSWLADAGAQLRPVKFCSLLRSEVFWSEKQLERAGVDLNDPINGATGSDS